MNDDRFGEFEREVRAVFQRRLAALDSIEPTEPTRVSERLTRSAGQAAPVRGRVRPGGSIRLAGAGLAVVAVIVVVVVVFGLGRWASSNGSTSTESAPPATPTVTASATTSATPSAIASPTASGTAIEPWSGLASTGAQVYLGDVTLIFSWPGGLLARAVNNPVSLSSSDARTWTELAPRGVFGNEAGFMDGIAWNGKEVLATGKIAATKTPTPMVWASSDGKTWATVDTQGTFDPAQDLVDLTANSEAFVGATQAGVVWRSSDGKTWASEQLPGATNIRVVQVIASSSAFAIVAENGGHQGQIPNEGVTIWSSADGSTWKSIVLTTADWGWDQLFVLGDRFVAYEGADQHHPSNSLPKRAWQSADGYVWSPIGTPPAGFTVVGSNGSLLVAQQESSTGGVPFVLEQSIDGSSWTSLPIDASTRDMESLRAVVPGGVFVSVTPLGANLFLAGQH